MAQNAQNPDVTDKGNKLSTRIVTPITGNDGKGGETFANLQKKRSNSMGQADRYNDQRANAGFAGKVWSAIAGKQ